MIQPLLVSIAAGAATVAWLRRDWTSNFVFVAVLAGLLAAFGPAVGAY